MALGAFQGGFPSGTKHPSLQENAKKKKAAMHSTLGSTIRQYQGRGDVSQITEVSSH